VFIWQCLCLCGQRQTADVLPVGDVIDAHTLLYLGDSVSTDQISLAGSIARNTPAARYLSSQGYVPSFTFYSLRVCSPGEVGTTGGPGAV